MECLVCFTYKVDTFLLWDVSIMGLLRPLTLALCPLLPSFSVLSLGNLLCL